MVSRGQETRRRGLFPDRSTGLAETWAAWFGSPLFLMPLVARRRRDTSFDRRSVRADTGRPDVSSPATRRRMAECRSVHPNRANTLQLWGCSALVHLPRTVMRQANRDPLYHG